MTEATDPALSLANLLRPEVLADPYPFYRSEERRVGKECRL